MPSRAPSPLLAVLLTAESWRGSTLVFRWPPAPSLFKRHSRVRYYRATTSENDGSRSPPRQSDASQAALHRGSYVRGRAEGVAAPWEEMQERATRDEEGASASDTSESSGGDESGLSDFNDVDLDVGSSAASTSGGDDAILDHFSDTNPLPRPRARLGSSSILSGPATGSSAAAAAARSRSRPPAPLRDARSSPSPDRERERQAGRAKRAAKSYGRYLGYDEAFLATLLSPRPEACHAKFELVVDDLAFVGHPVCVDAEGKWSAPPDTPSSTGAAAGSSKPRGRTGGTSTSNTDAQHNEERDSSTNTGESRGVTAFHLVLVLDRPDPSAALPQLDISAWSALYHDAVAFKLTAALWAEEVRCSYVGRESDRLTSLREACRDRGDSYTTYLSSALRTSSLARLLRSLHSSLARSANAFVSVNDSIDAHLQLPPLLHDGARLGRLREVETSLDANDPLLAPGAGGRWAGTGDAWAEASRTTGPLLLPWKTLLIMGSPRHGKEAEDEDASSQASASEEELKDGIEAWAKRFTSYLKPTLSGIPTFAELADLLSWDLHADVYPMVRHLIYYREARVVDVPRIHSTYALSPLFDLRDLAPLSHSWHRSFPSQPLLPEFLASLTAALRPFAALFIKTQRQTALDCLVWLLRHDVVVQMHVRLRLVATEEVKRAAARKRATERERKRERLQRIEELRRRREARARRKAEKAAAEAAFAASSPPEGTVARPRASQVAAVLAEQREHQRGRSREREGVLMPRIGTAPSSTSARVVSSASGSSRAPSLSPATPFTKLSSDVRREASASTELRFERRRVLRSRSPSTLFSSSGAAHSALSASVKATHPTPLTSLGNTSRPSTPRGRALSLRETGLTSASSSVHGSVGAVATVGRRPSRTGGTSRSPSRARLRVTGFGDGEEVHIDDDEEDAAGVSGSLLAQRLKFGGSTPFDGSSSATASASGSGSGGGASLAQSVTSTAGRTKDGSTLVAEIVDEARRLSLVGEVSEEPSSALQSDALGLENTVVLTPPAINELSDDSDEDHADNEEEEDDGTGVASEIDEWECDPVSSIIAEPSRASGEENEWIAAIAEGHEEWLVRRLFSLLPYLNGRHTVDEIVYREEMRRRELRALLQAFSADIITVVHP